MTLAAPAFTHLLRLTDAGGLYEHAEGTTPRPEHGYCLDDVARALVVVCREPDPTPEVLDLRAHYLSFVLAAESGDGRFRNRRGTDLRWRGLPRIEDCWGRALFGLGTALRYDAAGELESAALAAFERAAQHRPPWSRAMAFAGLGAAELLAARPHHAGAIALLRDAAAVIGRPAPSPTWPWPEARLRYANATLPETLLAAGAALGDDSLVADGLLLLGWLLDLETRDGHLSVTPVGGRGPGDVTAGFDQQPIEVAALAEACGRAHALTGDPRWSAGLDLAVGWFFGANDAATDLSDASSGGGCDGLERLGRNENQGAESTLALLSTLQVGRRLALAAR